MNIENIQKQFESCTLIVDKKHLITLLRATKDNFVKISINPNDKSSLMIYDRFTCNVMATRN